MPSTVGQTAWAVINPSDLPNEREFPFHDERRLVLEIPQSAFEHVGVGLLVPGHCDHGIRVAGKHAVAGETILERASCRVAFSEVVKKRNGCARLNGDHPKSAPIYLASCFALLNRRAFLKVLVPVWCQNLLRKRAFSVFYSLAVAFLARAVSRW